MRRKHLPLGVLLVAVLGYAASAGTQGTTTAPSKPLSYYTIGDLIPRITSAALSEVGAAWKRSGEELRAHAEQRRNLAADEMAIVRKEIDGLKAQLKLARAEKRTVDTGTLTGQLQAQEDLHDILERLDQHAREQDDLAEALLDTADALTAFDEADRSFDVHRSRRLAQAQDVRAELADPRLDAAGYDAFAQRARALERLGRAMSDLGSELETISDGNAEFMKELDKGGRLQPRR